MELKELIATFRRWTWLLIIGLVGGLLGGYLVSSFMEPVYEGSTKLMISREVLNENPDFAGLNSQQLVQTYVQILGTNRLLDAASEKVGIEVDKENISIQQIIDTQIIEIRVQHNNPEEAALIANTMVQVLNEQSEDLQTGQYTALEERLSKQVLQVKEQIDGLQSEFDEMYESDYEEQLSMVEEQLTAIQIELSTLQEEIDTLRPELRLSDGILLAEKQARVNQIQSTYVIYEQIRANLLILGRPLEYGSAQGSPQLQQMQSTIDLYQKLYLTLIEELERVRLARIQQTPNIVQIEAATVPKNPVRPIPILYTALSGMVGLMLAVGIMLFYEALKADKTSSLPALEYGNPWQLEPPDTMVKDNPARKALIEKKGSKKKGKKKATEE